MSAIPIRNFDPVPGVAELAAELARLRREIAVLPFEEIERAAKLILYSLENIPGDAGQWEPIEPRPCFICQESKGLTNLGMCKHREPGLIVAKRSKAERSPTGTE